MAVGKFGYYAISSAVNNIYKAILNPSASEHRVKKVLIYVDPLGVNSPHILKHHIHNICSGGIE